MSTTMTSVPVEEVLEEEENQTTTLGALDERALVENEATRGALQLYTMTHPRPILIVPRFREQIGLSVAILIMAITCAILISAIRVGTILMISEALLGDLYIQAANIAPWTKTLLDAVPSLMFILALGCFEGYLVFHGIDVGRTKGSLKTSTIGVIVTLVVTLSSGLLSSFTLADTTNPIVAGINQFIVWVNVLFTGIGAPLLAYQGAQAWGVLQNRHEEAKKLAETKHGEELRTWTRNFEIWFNRKARRRLGLKDESERKEDYHEEEVKKVQASVSGFLDQHGLTAHDVGTRTSGAQISPKQVAEELHLNPDRVRLALHRLRQIHPKEN